MPKEISLKLCLLTSLEERSREEVESEALVSAPENDRDRGDRPSPVSVGLTHKER